MRIYNSLREAISETFRDISELGIENKTKTMQDINIENNNDYITKELIFYGFTVLNTDDKDDIFKVYKEKYGIELSKEWAESEFAERISNKSCNPGKAYKLRSVWEPFIHGGKFAYNYQERLVKKIDKVLNILSNDHGTRQAILPIFDGGIDLKNAGGKRRIPCSLSYDFLIRKSNGIEKLHMIYKMRSTDWLTHSPYDIYLAIRMQEYFAEKLGIQKGSFTFFANSLHCYAKDINKYHIF